MILDKINVLGITYNNASNISSAADIIIGSFRYCVNNPKNITAAQIMLKKLLNLMWKTTDKSGIHLIEKGVTFRPKKISNTTYQTQYKELKEKLNNLLN